MSNILQLNCWVIRDDPRHQWHVIPVEIASSKTVSYIKEAIKEKIKHCSFADFDAKSLDLWKVSNHIQHFSNNEFIF
jgi:Crinkler effector protein N-terminal domain